MFVSNKFEANERTEEKSRPFDSIVVIDCTVSLTARFMGPTWGPSGADRTQVVPMLAPCWPHELCYMGKLSLRQFTVPSVTTQLSNWQPFVFTECVLLPRKTGLCPYYVVNDESVDVLLVSGVRASGGMFCNLTDAEFFTHVEALIN